MILVIDNYDSFVYNLVQYLGELGAELEVARNDELSVDEVTGLQPQAIVISPGPGAPEEAGVCLEVIRRLGASTPILGICLGHQCIGQAYGGRVGRAPELRHGKSSAILHGGRDLYEGLPSPFQAGRYHSLIVEESGLPPSLEVTARTPEGLIMGLCHRVHPVEGVQFHPESVLTPEGRRLLANFLSRCGLRSEAPNMKEVQA